MIKVSIISLFPEFCSNYLSSGMMLKASEMKLVEFEAVNLRDFGRKPRNQVDDTPYGGGGGMILQVEPLYKAIEFIKNRAKRPVKVILLTPRGDLFNYETALKLSKLDEDLIFIGGRYEGYDERITNWVDMQLSLGQFVVTGFELPALCVIDSLVRLIPGVLGNKDGSLSDSFSFKDQLIEYPQYTKPEIFKGLNVPEVLLSGNHQAIDNWRKDNMKNKI